MYRCTDCGKKFTALKTKTETHNLATPPFEEFKVCPYCGSSNYKKTALNFCKCCGARMLGSGDYCSAACEVRAEKIRRRELSRKNFYAADPVMQAVRQAEAYNKEHNTDYSYGQLVAIGVLNTVGGRKNDR